MAITVNCETIDISYNGGTTTFNKANTTVELSNDRVNLIQRGGFSPTWFWWDLDKAISDGYGNLQSLFDFLDYSINDRCGGGGGSFDGVLVDNETVFGDGLTTPLSSVALQTGKYRISGGAAWSGTGLIYDVSIINYYFNGNKYTVATQKTLDASDPTNNRFDAVVVNEAGVVSIIKGTASASPVFPIIPDDKILVQYILVTAASVTPIIVQDQIHADNPTTNWTASNFTLSGAPVGSTNFSATTSPIPQKGSNYIKNIRDNQTGVKFARTSSINLSDYTYLTVWVYLPVALNVSKKLNVRWEDASGVLIGNVINLFDYGVSRTNIGVWQMAYVPIYSFGSITTIKGLQFILDGDVSQREWNIDNILIGNGIVSGTSPITPLNSISPANSANIINNKNFTQEWQWNSQTNQPMLKLSSTSTLTNTGGNGLEINLTGTLVAANQITYAAKFINSRSSTNGANSGAYFEGNNSYGVAIQTGSSQVGGFFGGADIAIGANGALRWNNGVGNGAYIAQVNATYMAMNPIGQLIITPTSSYGVQIGKVFAQPEIALSLQSATRSAITFGADCGGTLATQYRCLSTTACLIERDLGKLLLSSNVGLAGGMANFTPTYQICVDGTNNNVAIGKGNTAGDASAKLELSSTTQGFLPPRMTASQASAIASPAKSLIVYVTDTNGTFTSAGIWIYTTSWKLILAE